MDFVSASGNEKNRVAASFCRGHCEVIGLEVLGYGNERALGLRAALKEFYPKNEAPLSGPASPTRLRHRLLNEGLNDGV